jgi:hypothetical protein
MPFTKHQLEHPSHNVPLTDPAWAEATLAEAARVLGTSAVEADRQFPDVVRLAIIEDTSGYGPRDSVQQVLWTFGLQVVRMWRMRPGSGYRPINVGTPDELPGEQGSPDQHDARGLAIQLGKEAQYDAALAVARARTNGVVALERNIRDADGNVRPDDDPKVVRVAIKDRLRALKDELSGAAAANRARSRPPAPVGPPDGKTGEQP